MSILWYVKNKSSIRLLFWVLFSLFFLCSTLMIEAHLREGNPIICFSCKAWLWALWWCWCVLSSFYPHMLHIDVFMPSVVMKYMSVYRTPNVQCHPLLIVSVWWWSVRSPHSSRDDSIANPRVFNPNHSLIIELIFSPPLALFRIISSSNTLALDTQTLANCKSSWSM